MKFEIKLEQAYPHPIEKVWEAITDSQALGEWLMENDFEPLPGGIFRMWCADGEGGTDVYVCEILEFEPPHRMVWSWMLEGQQTGEAMRVEFRLAEVEDGTHLTIHHNGDRDPHTIEKFEGGWPAKLEQLNLILRVESGASP